MHYSPITCEQREAMLRAVGVSTVEDLFEDIPAEVRLDRQLDLPDPMTEMELSDHLAALASVNRPATALVSFAGAGCYDHYIPSVVDHVLRRPEFFTAYTPYQPEVSQGTLQAIYEFQSMICALTGMEVANASMYDGATAFVEAAMMACRVTRRHTVVCADTVHPEWRATLDTYTTAGGVRVLYAPRDAASGRVSVDGPGGIAELLANGDVAAVLVQSPGYSGHLEDLAALADAAHDAGALLVVGSNPILLGILEPPSAFGADIVVGEGQPLGNPQSFGGPGLGFFACRTAHIRQMPGRLVGRTLDVDGSPAFVLTLATREQHIRREKATSNICSNHALNALAAGVYLAAVGRSGLEGIARSCVAKAHYMHEQLLATGRFHPVGTAPFGYEFTVTYDGDVAAMQAAML
ncbi:MAG: aminomethyl-transferring glycine dehydrogenase subunit GcvPA, partial [Coriobacteriia bacterium]|nr:aminomethyl-transferring glycine dehydrogenase subunit GcvPA [Coriobacteriia bacterium]